MPNATEWARWLKTNLPPYVGEMQITAKWKTGSALVVFVLPIEIWLGLPERDAYSFIEYHGGWDAATARREQAALLVPGLQLQENRRPGGGELPAATAAAAVPAAAGAAATPQPRQYPAAPGAAATRHR